MTIEQKIKMALAYKNISQAELARKLGTSAQNLSQKIKRGGLTALELEEIAKVLGAEYKFSFEFDDGTKI